MKVTGRWLLIWGAITPWLLGTDFRGCAGDPPPDTEPLPVSTVCVADADCVSEDACVIDTCVSGVCVPGGPAIDADGDGFAPSPCGDDCDDTDPRTFPGSAERCDGLDQDCDADVDEGATGATASRLDDDLSDASIEGFGNRFAVVGRRGTELLAYQVDATGRMRGVPALVAGDGVDGFAVAESDGRLFLAVTAGLAPPRLIELREAAGAFVPLDEGLDIGAVGGATDIAATTFAGEVWVLYDVTDGTRWLARQSALSTPISVDTSASAAGPVGLASAGDRLAVATTAQRVIFYSESGTEVARQTLSGAFADHPLASGDGLVYAAYRDAFDHVLTRITTGSIASPNTAPSGDRDDRVAIYQTPPNILVTRLGTLGLRGWVLAPDLRTFVTTFDAETLAPDGTPNAVSVATNADGLSAILASYDGRSTIAVLSCEGG